MRKIMIGLTMACLLSGEWTEPARGDGGTVRLSRTEGKYRISVFTAPTPIRAGPVDISVLVQDAATGAVIPEAEVVVVLNPCGRPDERMRQSATSAAATNKLFKAAVFELPAPGCWNVQAAIAAEQGSAQVRFELEAAGPAPRWPALWPWIGWPALVIVLFFIHEVLVMRKLRRRT